MTVARSGDSPPTTHHPVQATPVTERVLAPDLARGMMLLLIALAHVPWFIYDAPAGIALLHPAHGNLADKIAQILTIVIVDARTHTMFGFLFAYGIGQMYARQTARGTPPARARRLLRTRHLWLLAFGAVHAALLWQGDILGTYGLIGLLMMPLFFNRSDRTLKIWIVVLLVAGALLSALTVLSAMAAPAGEAIAAADLQRLSIAEAGFLLSAAIRVPTWIFGLFSGVATLALPTVFLIGLLAARHRVLDEPARHLPLLRRVALTAIPLGWAAGAVLGLEHTGVITTGYESVWSTLHFYTGTFTGVGYAALFGLLAHFLATRDAHRALPVQALVALGRRSLSGYLAQSVVFAPVFAAWGLGWGMYLSSWSAVGVAVGTWVLTVAAALWMERAGVRGPAETLLRTLTYRGTTRRVHADKAR
ncbi:DUF418 domain-containing protein [Nocardiopsis ansamitocini]|uniref:DUF418 domain-containing protein n=1 Tax=Nocardiopsis ansamitocini TaxID=1670832 RepID=A0A9W6P775_9ACTN|nr:DUF418 domain-containing protein [Nocardiopsis ansamitocini]GLU48401.1 hypothetical protein Nans01_27520 [Nocardiopsis ansamitocini]